MNEIQYTVDNQGFVLVNGQRVPWQITAGNQISHLPASGAEPALLICARCKENTYSAAKKLVCEFEAAEPINGLRYYFACKTNGARLCADCYAEQLAYNREFQANKARNFVLDFEHRREFGAVKRARLADIMGSEFTQPLAD
jgi:hypothetical protein